MIITVPPMRMMQMIIHEIIDMITMGHRLVPAAGAVCVASFVLAAAVLRRTRGGVRGAHVQVVLLDAVALLMMQVSIVKVVRVAVVGDGGMAAPRAMMVRVSLMGLLLGCHMTVPRTMS
jgi:hypothetical protein